MLIAVTYKVAQYSTHGPYIDGRGIRVYKFAVFSKLSTFDFRGSLALDSAHRTRPGFFACETEVGKLDFQGISNLIPFRHQNITGF